MVVTFVDLYCVWKALLRFTISEKLVIHFEKSSYYDSVNSCNYVRHFLTIWVAKYSKYVAKPSFNQR